MGKGNVEADKFAGNKRPQEFTGEIEISVTSTLRQTVTRCILSIYT
jgi:hypothetical protein